MKIHDWGRRLISIPSYGALFLLIVATLPLTLPSAALWDALRRTPWGATRSILFFAWYLGCEVAGIIASFALWLLRLGFTGSREERYLDWHFRLQCWWARSLLAGASRIFGLRIEVEGDGEIGAGPVLVFMRHASVGDTLLPAVFLSDRHGIRLRYVMKRELLWDPCLDIVGNRLPNYFVMRGSHDSAREIVEVSRLADKLEAGEGVLIFPEGTRFTEEKRSRIFSHLERQGSSLAERARALRHVLPPRTGGALALLERTPEVDVVFGVHVGFEGTTRFSDLLGGSLVGARIRVRFWRVAGLRVPRGPEERVDWLLEQWALVDSWIAENLSGSEGRPVAKDSGPAS